MAKRRLRPCRWLIGVVFISALYFFIAGILHAYLQPTDIYLQPIDIPSLSYDYDFDSAPGLSTVATISDNKILVPAAPCPWDSGLLKMRIAPDWHSKLLPFIDDSPYVAIYINDQEISTQYFEHGFASEQYLNISSASKFSAGNPVTIKLKGHHVIWSAQQADIQLFCNPPLVGRRILVIAPHPDDAEIAAFGLYSQDAANTFVVTITAGGAGLNKYLSLYDSEVAARLAKARLRVWDSVTVPLLGGLSPDHVANLGYFDGTLAEMFNSKAVEASPAYSAKIKPGYYRKQNISTLLKTPPTTANWTSLVRDLVNVLGTTNPDVIIMPHPLLDSHKDHQLSAIATLEALEKTGKKSGSLYFYTNHPPTDRFPFGPRDGIVSLAPTSGRVIHAEGFRSFPIDRETQTMKLFALEAMHDIRPSNFSENTEYGISIAMARIIRILKNTSHDLVFGYHPDFYSLEHIRRAARPNEIFIIYPAAQANKLKNIFINAVM
jgi:LmbE family N-acetylglucosaminyl deacetylase